MFKSILFGSLFVLALIAGVACVVQVELYDTSETGHTIGWWPNGIKKYTSPPYKSVIIPIEDGEYLGKPSHITFAKYLAMCVVDTSYMNVDKYLEFINQ